MRLMYLNKIVSLIADKHEELREIIELVKTEIENITICKD